MKLEKDYKRKLQLKILDIAKDIDKLCKDNNIEYYILYGSGVGAVRHKGFIPWDDDFDIGLVYKTNADKFENVLHELINWMRDHEQGVGLHDNIWNVYEFFPDCGCKRTTW